MGGGTSPNKSAAEIVATADTLAEFLGTKYRKIKYFYYSRHVSSYYSVFLIPKKSGGVRQIRAPSNQLKMLQIKLLDLLKMVYKPKPSVKGFVDGLSIVDNAVEHTRKKFVFNIDLRDFFHSVTFPRVRGLLVSEPYNFPPNVASIIAHLSTVDGCLPQGAPTSPILSNMVCSRLDRELNSLARSHRASYTRYADDITFSFYCPIEHIPSDIVELKVSEEGFSHYGAMPGLAILEIIKSNGFSVNLSKVRLQGRYERQVVTGLVVNKKVNVDRQFVRKTCALIHSMERYGLEQATLKGRDLLKDLEFNIEPHVQGRVLFIKQVQGFESPVYQRIAARFNALPSAYKVPVLSKFTSPELPAGSIAESASPGVSLGKSMMARCWVINVDEVMSQGSGFMLASGLLVTCAHILVGEGESDWSKHSKECEVFRVSDKAKKIPAKVVHFDKNRDIALLSVDAESKAFEYLSLEDNLFSAVDDEVSIWGFPNYKDGSSNVGRIWALISNSFVKSCVNFHEVDKTLFSGNSGGPVLNQAGKVVGIAARGAVEGAQLNAFICASELIKVLDDYN